MKSTIISINIVIVLCGISNLAQAEWKFGLGTGYAIMDWDGDVGFDTVLGPAQPDLDLDPDDIMDDTDSAFGFGGYAANGKWKLRFSYGQLDLSDKKNSGNTQAKVDFDYTNGEFIVDYSIYENISIFGGARYYDQELKGRYVITGVEPIANKSDNDWTDAVIGASVNLPFAEKWSWSNRLDVGFGGSEGTYTFDTALNWRFHEKWSASFYYKYSAVDYENSSRGSPNWYKWDVDETRLGFTVLYDW